jgi:hypothetical protein
MKAKMTLLADGDKDAAVMVFDWDEILETSDGDALVSQISIYDEKPIINGKQYSIIHMLSAESFSV